MDRGRHDWIFQKKKKIRKNVKIVLCCRFHSKDRLFIPNGTNPIRHSISIYWPHRKFWTYHLYDHPKPKVFILKMQSNGTISSFKCARRSELGVFGVFGWCLHLLCYNATSEIDALHFIPIHRMHSIAFSTAMEKMEWQTIIYHLLELKSKSLDIRYKHSEKTETFFWLRNVFLLFPSCSIFHKP